MAVAEVQDWGDDESDGASDSFGGAQVLEALSEEECYLWAILNDRSGLDLMEFVFVDDTSEDGCWRAWPVQWAWWRNAQMRQVDHAGRSLGKSESIKARACVHPFVNPGQEMAIVGPEKIHVSPVTSKVETALRNIRLLDEMLAGGNQSINKWPFVAKFKNGATIVGRIPQRDGRGLKGLHPVVLELDEAQDFPEKAWIEIRETLRRELEYAQWRVHGVSKGIPDEFQKITTSGQWKVHRLTAYHKPTWSDEELVQKLEEYGSVEDPEFRRNVLGVHGDSSNSIFDISRLMKCLHKETLVWVERGDGLEPIPIKDVRVGDWVRNAVGSGEVTRVLRSCHTRVLRLTVDGEQFVCTADHRWFTSEGWKEAGDLRPGDGIATEQGLSDLREAVHDKRQMVLLKGLRSRSSASSNCGKTPSLSGVRTAHRGKGQAVLFDLVSRRQGSAEERAGVFGVRGSASGWTDQVLQSGMLGEIERDETAISCLPALWIETGRHRSKNLLLDNVCIRSSGSGSEQDQPVRGLWNRNIEPSVLLEKLYREMAWGECWSGSCRLNQDLRRMWGRILSSVKEDTILQPEVRRRYPWEKSNPGSEGFLFDLSPGVSSSQENAKVLLSEVLDGAEAPASIRAGGFESGSDGAMEGTRRPGCGMASGVLDVSAWRAGRLFGHASGSCSRGAEDRRRSGRERTQLEEGTGRQTRWLAKFARVDSAEVLEPGDPEFSRIGGISGKVECYDLTVSGHPSFFVGEQQLLVHNCVDDEDASTYNQHEYYRKTIKFEQVADLAKNAGLPPERYGEVLASMLEFPAAHKDPKYGPKPVYWVGMDVGISKDPSAVMVFVDYVPSAEERREHKAQLIALPAPGVSRMKLLSRIELQRIPVPDQASALVRVVEFYNPRAVSIDATGNGLGVVQALQKQARISRLMRIETDAELLVADPDRAGANKALTVIKGYDFGSKIYVEIDEIAAAELPADATKEELLAHAGRKKQVKTHATDQMRLLVDTGRMLFPHDETLIKQLTGQTFVYTHATTDAYGDAPKKFSAGQYHAFDGARMGVMGKVMQAIEEFIREPPPDQEDVIDVFLGGY